MRVLESSGTVRRSQDFPQNPAGRRVEMERGRAGYGFTIAGQAPCVLSAIMKGSPAYSVGLRPGDCILSVNGTDVSKASHETVVELIGESSRSLCLLVTSEDEQSILSSTSDEELAFNGNQNTTWLNPGKTSYVECNNSKFYGKDLREPLMQSVGSFDTLFEISGQDYINLQAKRQPKQRPVSEPDMPYWSHQLHSKYHPVLTGQEEPTRVTSKDSLFSDSQSQNDILPDSSALNVGMVVGYLSSMELDLMTTLSEEETLNVIRGCIRRIGMEQNTHSLVMMRIKCNCVQLCDDRDVVLAAYSAEKLALGVICTEDSRFFGLVSVETTQIDKGEDSIYIKTLCHVFFIDPDLYDHKEHKGITNHFGFSCTPDPDTQGCLEFPQTPHSILQFVSVVYTDIGEYIEKLRIKLDTEDSNEGQPSTRNSGSGDSGIGTVSPDDQENLADQWSVTSPNSSYQLWSKTPPSISQLRNGKSLKPERKCLLVDPFPVPAAPAAPKTSAFNPPPYSTHLVKQPALPESTAKRRDSQRWPSVGIRARWQKTRPNSVESLADTDAGGGKGKNNTLPPAMEQIPTLRYKTPRDLSHPDLTRKLFSSGSKNKDGENKGSKFWGLTRGRSSVRRSTRNKRLSLARSLDDLESAASDADRAVMKRPDCGSISSLDSNGSLPCVPNHHRVSDRRVASWAICFERLLQDPVGVRYFSEFLKKEYSEENILFWQACEFFSQVPEQDKKQLSQKAREIYNSFLSSKATTPVNIDSQAQLADDVLTAPRPDMFKQPQLQIFNLMKFDSYARFLKSSLYQECVLAEVEGRPLPDPYQVPCSPAPSKHSFSSDRSTFSTPKKDPRRPRSGRSSDDLRDESDKKNGIFSWNWNRSFGKGPKKREITDFSFSTNGRRESQGSLSSSTSQDLNTSSSTLKNESDQRNSTLERERERASRSCTVSLPDGSSCCVALRQGASIRQVLLELCQKHHINLAAVDLFLVGGEKPLVLDQDSMTLSSRDLRLERRTLFRLDLVPINRSVGLKAKPTKPVAEVLRPVVAKYGLRLSDLVARISGETEALDLGLPISNLDGLRVVLERADPSSSKEKSKTIPTKKQASSLTDKGQTTAVDHKTPSKSGKGENGDKHSTTEPSLKGKSKKLHMDDAEEFFELLSRAQSSRADDQRGLLRKEDLVLPDFLRLTPAPPSAPAPTSSAAPPTCSTPTSQKTGNGNLQAVTSNGHPPRPGPEVPPLSPILCRSGPQGQDGEGLGDLTLVGEGDITSPNSTLLPPSPILPPPHEGSLPEANFTPPPPCARSQPSSGLREGGGTCAAVSHHQVAPCPLSPAVEGTVALNKGRGVDGVTQEDSFEGYAAELRQCQSKMRNGNYASIDPTRPINNLPDMGKNNTTQYKATFV